MYGPSVALYLLLLTIYQPQAPSVPGVIGTTVIWPALQATEVPASFRKTGGASRWHSDLVHERQPAGVTHLHNDTIPKIGGDTLWASGVYDLSDVAQHN